MLLKRDIITLAKAKTVEHAEIIPDTGGFCLAIFLADKKMQVLHTDRKQKRIFKSLDAAYKMVSEIGLTEVTLKLDMAG